MNYPPYQTLSGQPYYNQQQQQQQQQQRPLSAHTSTPSPSGNQPSPHHQVSHSPLQPFAPASTGQAYPSYGYHQYSQQFQQNGYMQLQQQMQNPLQQHPMQHMMQQQAPMPQHQQQQHPHQQHQQQQLQQLQQMQQSLQRPHQSLPQPAASSPAYGYPGYTSQFQHLQMGQPQPMPPPPQVVIPPANAASIPQYDHAYRSPSIASPIALQRHSSLPPQNQSQQAPSVIHSPHVQHPPSVRPSPSIQARPSPVSIKSPRPPSRPSPKTKVKPSPKQAPQPSPKQPKAPPLPDIGPEVALSLAEEYITSANKIKFDAGADNLPETYYQTLTYGLGCLKAVLVRCKLQPAAEAAVRLRYASLLFSETTNYNDIDDVLSAGISLCDRHRLLDLKYDMMYLQARSMYATNYKAALRYLDKAISDTDNHRHIPWLYAFRFLRASLSLTSRQQQETVMAVNQVKQIAEKASAEGDAAVATLAYGLEAHIQLSRANSSDAIDQAQRALASARSVQLDSQVKKVPQLVLIPHFVDVACSIYQADVAQSQAKMKGLQEALDSLSASDKWSTDGTFEVPMSERTSRNMQTSDKEAGCIRRNEEGQMCLRVNWLDKEQLYGLGYLVNAVVVHHKAVGDEYIAAEQLLEEAKVMFDESEQRMSKLMTSDESMTPNMQALLLTSKIFDQFTRQRWADVQQSITSLEGLVKKLPENSFSPWPAMIQYMHGVVHHILGNLEDALKSFQHTSLALCDEATYRTPLQRELAILATMNRLLIIRMPLHPLHSTYSATLDELQPLAAASANKNIFSAYNLMRAAMPDLQNTLIIESKAFLQTALQAAKQTFNNQLMTITLNILSYKFFRGIVGEQAEKSGRATQTLARKGKSTLWISVAERALAETLYAHGKTADAGAVWQDAISIAARLPANMRGRIGDGQDTPATLKLSQYSQGHHDD